MPRYFLDCHDGRALTVDKSGLDLAGREAARLEADGLLPELVRDMLPNGDCSVCTVSVRTAAGFVIYTASLCFVGRWLDGSDALPEPDGGAPGVSP